MNASGTRTLAPVASEIAALMTTPASVNYEQAARLLAELAAAIKAEQQEK
jgi:hypothetical protein